MNSIAFYSFDPLLYPYSYAIKTKQPLAWVGLRYGKSCCLTTQKLAKFQWSWAESNRRLTYFQNRIIEHRSPPKRKPWQGSTVRKRINQQSHNCTVQCVFFQLSPVATVPTYDLGRSALLRGSLHLRSLVLRAYVPYHQANDSRVG